MSLKSQMSLPLLSQTSLNLSQFSQSLSLSQFFKFFSLTSHVLLVSCTHHLLPRLHGLIIDTTMTTNSLQFIDELSPTQEHFLKKFLLESRLKYELHYLGEPDCLLYLGPPFKSQANQNVQLPLLRFFFHQFVATFPLITNNTPEDQIAFWKETVQPFVESFNQKSISDAEERKELVTKRHQVNVRLLSFLLLYFNSMIISKKELQYLGEDHLKPSDKGKLDKLSRGPALAKVGLGAFQKPSSLHDYGNMVFVNDMNLNIVAVDILKGGDEEEEAPPSSWSLDPLRLLGTAAEGPKLHYSFVLQVTFRTKIGDSCTYRSHFISKPYLQFKKLEQQLKKKYPGVMTTEVGRLPRKMKHDDGISPDTASQSSSEKSYVRILLDSVKKDRPKYYREKLRLALRGYMNTLLTKPEIAHCDVFTGFLDSAANFDCLSLDQERDHGERMILEKQRLATQAEFQDRTAKRVFALTKDFEKFKAELVEQPHLLSKMFEEFSTTLLIAELSPFLRTFFEWCKLEIAATLYQVFLSQDNSSEWFSKCRRFHKIFPYNLCYGILKYTNPVKVVSRMVDLLLVNMPSVGWGSEKKKVNNLLLMIFIMLLDEDLQDYSKERAKLLESGPLATPEFKIFIERISYYVNEMQGHDGIKQESVENEANLLLTILQTDQIEPRLGPGDQKTLLEISKAYEAYVSIDDHKEVEGVQTYVALRQLWQLEVRSRDKQQMKQLWKEPELTNLIKRFLTVFYQPLMTVMKKCDIHLVFRDWQHFLDDLMLELAQLDEGDMYYTSSVEMFNRFKQLLDKHEHVLWRFMHDLYVKDDQQIFMGLIQWIESFLVALRSKYTDPDSVTLDFMSMVPSAPIDAAKFETELNTRIEAILEKRRLLKQYLLESANVKAGTTYSNSHEPVSFSGNATEQKMINERWEELNNGLFDMQGRDFGVDDADIEDFNLMHAHGKAADRDEEGELRALLRKIADLDREMEHQAGEISKLDASTHTQLCALLRFTPNATH